jgi:transposase
MREKNTPYPEQFRQQMVELVNTGRKPRELAAEFGCHESSIKHWLSKERGGVAASKSESIGAISANEREELLRLRRENKRLLVERDILSKATAWFAGNGAPMSIASMR